MSACPHYHYALDAVDPYVRTLGDGRLRMCRDAVCLDCGEQIYIPSAMPYDKDKLDSAEDEPNGSTWTYSESA